MKNFRRIIVSLLLVLTLFTGCDSNNTTPSQKNQESKAKQTDVNDKNAYRTMKTVTVDKTDAKKPIVTITMANDKVITAELYPDIAPITVKNFVSLIENKFYENIIFHRIIEGFMIQGGDPTGTGSGGSAKTIKGEFIENGIKNDLKHTRGVLSMARTNDPDSASSQFFIMHADYPSLNGKYAAFGRVLTGIEVVDEIVKSYTNTK